MKIRGEVASITMLPGRMHCIKFDCVLVGGEAGESFSREDMFLTVKAENNVYEIGKHYEFEVPVVAVEDEVPEVPEE